MQLLQAACHDGAALVARGGWRAAARGYDGVELQGGVFDALGVSGSGQKKLADVEGRCAARPRAAAVADKLPEPVTGSLAAAPTGEAWPVDPEDRRAAEQGGAREASQGILRARDP